MRSSAISRGLCAALLVTGAQAQTVAAGARAVVSSDTLPVYTAMSVSSPVKTTLARGDAVTIGLVMFGDDITWCAISKPGETRRISFATCEFLEQDRSSTPGAGNPAPPAAARAPSMPIPIREVPTAPTLPNPVREPAPAPPAVVSLPVRDPATPEPVAPSLPIREPASVPAPVREPALPEPTPIREPPPQPVVDPIPIREPTPPEPVAPPEPPSNPNDSVEASLDGFGLRAALSTYTQNTHLLSFIDKGRLAEIDVPALDRILSERFQSAAFQQAIIGQIRKNYSERLPELVAWLGAPVPKKMAELERYALRPDSRDELVAFAQGLTKSPPVEARLLLVHRLYDSLKTCDMEVASTIALVYTVAMAIGPALPKEKRYTGPELDLALGAVKTRYRSIMKNARLVHYLFAFQWATDGELEQYVGFLESEAGKWFVSLVDKGFYDATETISRGLLAEIPAKVMAKPR